MAGPYFWVGGSGNWSDATNHWATVSGGAPNVANVPTSTDNVNFDGASNATAYTVTVDATANCKDMTWALPSVSGVPTLAGTATLQIFGSLTNVATMLWTHSDFLNFRSTSTGKTVTWAGVTINSSNITFDGAGGGWTFQDNLISTASKTLEGRNGTLNTNAKTITVGFFLSTSGTRTLTLDNSTINITGTSGTPWNISTAGTLTFSATGSTINFNGGTANTSLTLTMAALTYGAVNITGTGLWFIGGGPTIKNFSYTSTTDKRDQLSVSTNFIIAASGSFTLAGNSTVNRAFFTSNGLGTQRTVFVPNTATVSLTNVDIQDIASGGTFGTWTGTSLGDALGNSGITFDGSTTQTYAGGTNNWSTLAAWTSRVPLPQDDVVVNTTTAGTLTADMPRLGRNIDFTSFTRSFQLGSQTAAFFGNLTLGASMTFGGGQTFQAQGRGAQTITSNGIGTPSTFQISAFGGTYTLQDSYTSGSAISMNFGTLDSQGFNITASNITPQATIKATSSSTWAFSNTSGTPWNANASTVTTNFFATIKFTGAITSATFAGAGKTYSNFWWSNTAATGTLIITGANTFNDFKVDGTTARTVQFPASTTNTVSSFTVSGADASHLTSITSSTSGTPATLSAASGKPIRCHNLSVKDSTATGGAVWYAGAASTNVSGNTGWIFGEPSYSLRTGIRTL